MATAMKNPRQKEKGGKFRVLVGSHIDMGPAGCECLNCLSWISNLDDKQRREWEKSGSGRAKNHRYDSWDTYASPYVRRGQRPPYRHYTEEDDGRPVYDNDIVESPDIDLELRFNTSVSRKFERVFEHTTVPAGSHASGKREAS